MTQGNKGFTLIEILITALIVAILATVAFPTYVARKRQSEYDSAVAQVQVIAAAEKTYFYGWNYLPTTTDTGTTNYALGIRIRDGAFHNYRIETIATDDFNVHVDYTRAGNTVTYTFNKTGDRISCVPPGPDCVS